MLHVLKSIKGQPKPTIILSPETLCIAMDSLAQRGFRVTLSCAWGGWHCEILPRMEYRKLSKEKRDDYGLLCADSGYGHKSSYKAFLAAFKIHKQKSPEWFKRHGTEEWKPPKMELIG